MRWLLLVPLLLTGCKVTDDRGVPCPSGRTVWDISSDNGACWKECAIHRANDGWAFCVRNGCGYQKVCAK